MCGGLPVILIREVRVPRFCEKFSALLVKEGGNSEENESCNQMSTKIRVMSCCL